MAGEKKTQKKQNFCPYCDEEIKSAPMPYCQACGVQVFYCPSCRKPVERGKKRCPSCGAEIRGEDK